MPVAWSNIFMQKEYQSAWLPGMFLYLLRQCWPWRSRFMNLFPLCVSSMQQFPQEAFRAENTEAWGAFFVNASCCAWWWSWSQTGKTFTWCISCCSQEIWGTAVAGSMKTFFLVDISGQEKEAHDLLYLNYHLFGLTGWPSWPTSYSSFWGRTFGSQCS